MQGFTGIKDLDKELMVNMGDREFIRTCGLNKYFQDICKDQYLFKRKLEKFYPYTLQPKIYDKEGITLSWKKYYSKVVQTVAFLKEKSDFDYETGDPFLHLRVIKRAFDGVGMFPYRSILHYGLLNVDLSLVKYAVEKESDINIGRYELASAAGFYDPTILKYLVEHGGNPSVLKQSDFPKFSEESKKYLESLKRI